VKVWLRLHYKVFFTWKCIKIIFFFILKKLFLISAYQNDLKTQKIYQFEAKNFFFKKNYFWYQRIKIIWKNTKKYINLKQRKKYKIFKFFQKYFWNAKTNRVLQNSVKKICKNCFTKTTFQTHFFSEPRSTKHSLVYYQTPCCVCFTTNTKTGKK